MLLALQHSTYWCVHTYLHASFMSSHLQNHYLLAQIGLKTANELKTHRRYMDRQRYAHISLFS